DSPCSSPTGGFGKTRCRTGCVVQSIGQLCPGTFCRGAKGTHSIRSTSPARITSCVLACPEESGSTTTGASHRRCVTSRILTSDVDYEVEESFITQTLQHGKARQAFGYRNLSPGTRKARCRPEAGQHREGKNKLTCMPDLIPSHEPDSSSYTGVDDASAGSVLANSARVPSLSLMRCTMI